MLRKLFSAFLKKEKDKEEVKEKGVRELTQEELELFKRAIGITPHNYWQWAGRTKNFKLLTDGEWVWVEGYEEHINKRLPLTEARAWSWEFLKGRIKELNL
ncbi:MAG: hypothetical protein GXO04_02105 [Aquificae bacterium]|nr:hypothetical protein [Aquificota bacterium]